MIKMSVWSVVFSSLGLTILYPTNLHAIYALTLTSSLRYIIFQLDIFRIDSQLDKTLGFLKVQHNDLM